MSKMEEETKLNQMEDKTWKQEEIKVEALVGLVVEHVVEMVLAGDEVM